MHSRPVRSIEARYKFWPKLIIITSLASALVALTYFWITPDNSQSTYIPNKTYKLTILNTTEFNKEYVSDITESNNQLIHRQALIKKIRNEVESSGGKLLLLSGGELNTDDDILSLRKLNQLGYNAMAVSPLLFDEPLNTIRTQEATANFPFLSANLYESETGRPVFDAYALFDFDGLRIAVMGLTGPENPNDGIAEYQRGIEVIDPLLAASEILPYLKRQADIVIVATQAIHYPNLSPSGNASTYPISKLEGIDLLVSNNTIAEQDTYRITEANITLNAPTCCASMRRIDLEFRNGQLKKTNSVEINLASNIESENAY